MLTFGLWGPAKMPPALLAKIQADVSKALELPETRQFFKTNSFERVDLTLVRGPDRKFQ